MLFYFIRFIFFESFYFLKWYQFLMSSPSSHSPTKSEFEEAPDPTWHIFEVALQKDPILGFGFNILGGIDQPHIPGFTGIFISRIRPDGPAFKDGRLRPGDRIISVDDKALSTKTHSEAVEVFQLASGKVRLLIEQDAESRILSLPSSVLPSPLTDSPAQETFCVSILKKSSTPATDPPSIAVTVTPSPAGPEIQLPIPSESMMTATVIAPNTLNNHLDKSKAESVVSSVNENGILISRSRQQSFRDPLISPPVDTHQRTSLSSSVQNGNLPNGSYSGNVDDEDDRVSTISAAPSTYSVIDDVPRTPKKPVSLLDPSSPSLITEAIFISIGAISLGIGIIFAIRYFKRR